MFLRPVASLRLLKRCSSPTKASQPSPVSNAISILFRARSNERSRTTTCNKWVKFHPKCSKAWHKVCSSSKTSRLGRILSNLSGVDINPINSHLNNRRACLLYTSDAADD